MAAACDGGDEELILGATTSLQDTGILDELIDAFERESGFSVTPVVAGSGQILELASRGEVDVTITHSPPDERAFIAEGFGAATEIVMENTFLLVGPGDDPAGVEGASNAADAFARIAAARAGFVSRGDESGTHRREMAIWAEARIDPGGESWYQESAVSQGENLLVAGNKQAYALVDSGTFLVLQDRVDLVPLLETGPNRYSVTLVDESVHEAINAGAARAFFDFMTSGAARELIQTFGGDQYGAAPFRPPALAQP